MLDQNQTQPEPQLDEHGNPIEPIAEPPVTVDPNLVTYFAAANYRNENRRFGIKTDDRRRHMYLIGKTGMGKSTVQENMIIQDIRNGNGLAVVDPHGDLVEKVVKFIPPDRINDVIYFNPADLDHPIAFNILENVDPEYKNLVSNGLVGVFKKIWADSWGPRLEYILINSILALIEYPGSTLLGVTRMLVDGAYRKKVVRNISDPVVKSFWVNEFNNYTEKFRNEAIAPIQNKVGQFLSSSLIRNIVGQPKSSLDMREVMDSGKILLMNLSKGRVGEENSALLGAMMITKIQLAAMSRVNIPEETRRDFYLYVDEFQNFATESFADILSEARKYRLDLILAHQYIEQLSDEVKAAVFGNVGTLVSFRVGATDAEELEKEFQPHFLIDDLVNLPAYHIYLRLMIDGVASEPFSATTLPPLSGETGNAEKTIRVSRERYSGIRAEVEKAINQWSGLEPKDNSGSSKGGGQGKGGDQKKADRGGQKKKKSQSGQSEQGQSKRAPVAPTRVVAAPPPPVPAAPPANPSAQSAQGVSPQQPVAPQPQPQPAQQTVAPQPQPQPAQQPVLQPAPVLPVEQPLQPGVSQQQAPVQQQPPVRQAGPQPGPGPTPVEQPLQPQLPQQQPVQQPNLDEFHDLRKKGISFVESAAQPPAQQQVQPTPPAVQTVVPPAAQQPRPQRQQSLRGSQQPAAEPTRQPTQASAQQPKSQAASSSKPTEQRQPTAKKQATVSKSGLASALVKPPAGRSQRSGQGAASATSRAGQSPSKPGVQNNGSQPAGGQPKKKRRRRRRKKNPHSNNGQSDSGGSGNSGNGNKVAGGDGQPRSGRQGSGKSPGETAGRGDSAGSRNQGRKRSARQRSGSPKSVKPGQAIHFDD